MRERHERVGKVRYCRECEFYTYKASTLSMHIMTKHRRLPEHKCEICSEWFSTKAQLYHHKLSKHTDKSIQCSFDGCIKSFKSKTHYHIHYVRKHMDLNTFLEPLTYSDEYKCRECRKVGTHNAMIYHVTWCSSLSPFSRKYENLDPLDDSDCFFPPCQPCNTDNTDLISLNNQNKLEELDENSCLNRFNKPLPINVMDDKETNELLSNVLEDLNKDSALFCI